jgi:hypothetical protein
MEYLPGILAARRRATLHSGSDYCGAYCFSGHFECLVEAPEKSEEHDGFLESTSFRSKRGMHTQIQTQMQTKDANQSEKSFSSALAAERLYHQTAGNLPAICIDVEANQGFQKSRVKSTRGAHTSPNTLV